MYKTKKILFLVLALSVFLNCNLISARANEKCYSTVDGGVSTEFIDSLFLGDSLYGVENYNQQNMKEIFIDENKENFAKKDYLSIHNYMIENNLVLTREINEPILNEGKERISVSYARSKDYQFSFTRNNIPVNYVVRISATFRVNDSTGVITSYSGPTLSLVSTSINTTAYLQDTSSTYESWSASKRSLSLSQSFTFVAKGNYGGLYLEFIDGRRTVSVSY